MLFLSCGGGYGDPAKRDPAKVASSVDKGWLTSERALEVYGVALSVDGNARS
jgi:N-methylhydantoinase B